MARSRNIKPTFFSNEYLGDLDPLARLLFVGLWCQADREGRLQDRPKRLKIDVLPYDECDVDRLLNDLAESKGDFIKRYTVDGNKYIQINNFLKHQNPHKKEAPSVIPEYCTMLTPYEHSTSTVLIPCEDNTNTESILYCTSDGMPQEQYNTDTYTLKGTVSASCEVVYSPDASITPVPDISATNNSTDMVQDSLMSNTSRADSLNPLIDSLNPINTYTSTPVDPPEQNHCPCDDIVKAFNTLCTSLPRVKQVTEGRRKKLKARWGELKNISEFENLFTKVQSSAFLKGSNNNGWKATFDWLIENDRNYIKVLEGNYDNNNSKPPMPPSGKNNRNFDQREYQEDFYEGFFTNQKGEKE